jgi:hypothetical protein
MVYVKELLTQKETLFLNKIIHNFRHKKQSKHKVSFKISFNTNIFDIEAFDCILFSFNNDRVAIGFVNEEWKYE